MQIWISAYISLQVNNSPDSHELDREMAGQKTGLVKPKQVVTKKPGNPK